ncbi:MAG: hypothetical protein AAB221_01405, partial [Bacteroidota bacterium]
MLQKIFVAAISLLSCHFAIAQVATINTSATDTTTVVTEQEKKEPALTITGSVDAYYKYDFGNTKTNSFTSFTQAHNSFSLGMASV